MRSRLRLRRRELLAATAALPIAGYSLDAVAAENAFQTETLVIPRNETKTISSADPQAHTSALSPTDLTTTSKTGSPPQTRPTTSADTESGIRIEDGETHTIGGTNQYDAIEWYESGTLVIEPGGALTLIDSTS